ncbi:uncharacterized protein LOC111062179 [Nilaparvata lugens]|uniref:uncharacterized protein LOC111062179 n=1 Tax=Nilaparvata lugens TaxID=108931 RepID=UPI00193E1F52|nr:uncharacterized protein LOC111062179 [Nilaparvata lugens]
MLKKFNSNRFAGEFSLAISAKKLLESRECNLDLSGVYSVSISERCDDSKVKSIMNALMDSQVRRLGLYRCNFSNEGAKVLAKDLHLTNIAILIIDHNNIDGKDATYLSDIVKHTRLIYLDISWNNLGDEGMKYIAEGLKNSEVITLYVGNNGIRSDGIKYLADVLPSTNITYLDLNQHYNCTGNFNEIGDEGVECLFKQLQYSNVSFLNLESTGITSYGVKCLSEHLENTCITSLFLKFNDLDDNATQYLRAILPKTLITYITYPYIDEITRRYMNEFNSIHYPSPNKTKESKVKSIFLKMVAQNTQTHDLEFIIPEIIGDIDLDEYVYIIKALSEKPMLRGYIFDLIRENNCNHYPQIIKKVNEFVTSIQKKSIEFIEKILPTLMESTRNNFVNIVREFENANLNEVVQHLLLHRVLFYVDEDAEILHPFIYKMLSKYEMPLYNERIEPNKKEKIIAFFQIHREIESANEIIELLKSKS